MHIRTSPNSLCSVSAVDKSTKYLTANEEFTINTLFKQFLQQNEAKDTSRLTCIQHMRKTAVGMFQVLHKNDIVYHKDLLKTKVFLIAFISLFHT